MRTYLHTMLCIQSGSNAASSGCVRSLSSCLYFIGFFYSVCLLAFLQLPVLGHTIYPSHIRLPAFLYLRGPAVRAVSAPVIRVLTLPRLVSSCGLAVSAPVTRVLSFFRCLLFRVPAVWTVSVPLSEFSLASVVNVSSCGLGSFCPVIRVLTRFSG